VDTDEDGLPDSVEGGRYPPEGKTHAYLPDSDGDGLLDGVEDGNRDGIRQASVETNPRSYDTDGDGYEDGIETEFLEGDPLNPDSPDTPCVDEDRDGLPVSLDPNDTVPDVDGDRFTDGYEAATLGADAVGDPGSFPGLGDVDGNGDVGSLDAQFMLNFFAGRDTPGLQPEWGDLDRNGLTDNVDAQLAVSFLGGELTLLPYTPSTGPGAPAEAAILSATITDALGNPLSELSPDVNDPAIGGADFVVALQTTEATGMASYSLRVHFDPRVIRFRDGAVYVPLEAGPGRRRGIIAVNGLHAVDDSHGWVDASAAGIKGFGGPQTLVRLGFDVVLTPTEGAIVLEANPDSSGPLSDGFGSPVPHLIDAGPVPFRTVEGGTVRPSLMVR
jgi:hypothetical protein